MGIVVELGLVNKGHIIFGAANVFTLFNPFVLVIYCGTVDLLILAKMDQTPKRKRSYSSKFKLEVAQFAEEYNVLK
jgi:hypothetical protein